MKFLHLSSIKNLNSIIKYGIQPTYIKNISHWEFFKDNEYLNNRKCVYLWDAETYNNTKFVKDMIYCKLFIHPRNDLFDIKEKENCNNWINFKKLGNHIYGNDEKYILFEIDSLNINYFGNWIHVQEPGDNEYSTTAIIDDRYSHDNKNMYITPNVINFKNIKIVEYINTRIYKNNQIGFSFIKN